MEKEENYDFDLPVDEDAPKVVAPRVHIGGSTCESCEGWCNYMLHVIHN